VARGTPMSGTLGLVRIMAAAEQLRWRLLLRRGAVRGGLALGALVFLVAALGMLHGLGMAALGPQIGWVGAFGCLTAVDLAMALLLMLGAARSGPGPGERTAVALRDAARAELLGRAQGLRLVTALVAELGRR
jgi:hypothetical protein